MFFKATTTTNRIRVAGVGVVTAGAAVATLCAWENIALARVTQGYLAKRSIAWAAAGTQGKACILMIGRVIF